MDRWQRVNAFLDKEVDRAVNAKFTEMKALLGKRANGKGNGEAKPIQAKGKPINFDSFYAATIKKYGPQLKKNFRKRSGLHKPSAARLQAGKWMGTIRSLSAADKAKAKKVREEKGFRAGIAEARRLRKAASA